MKIALIGNMANNMFTLARYLRDAGFSAEVLRMEGEPDYYVPINDSLDPESPTFVKSISWTNLPSGFSVVSKKNIHEALCSYDVVMGCSAVPAYLSKIGRRLDFFIPYGSDLYRLPFLNLSQQTLFKWHKQINLQYHQRNGIRNARFVVFDATNPEFEKVIKGIDIKGERIKLAVPTVYMPQYTEDNIREFQERSKFYPEFIKIRQNHDFMIFHHSRHEWKNYPNQWTYKGNDKLINGFANFIKSSSVKACLVMLDYGSDYLESKELVKRLKIEKAVFWFPVMPRKELMMGINLADMGVGELGMSWLSYGAIYEFIALGKPVMHHREDSLYQKDYPTLYPMVSAYTAEDVERCFHDFTNRPEFYVRMGKEAREWFKKNVIEISIKKYKELLSRNY